MDRLKPLRDRFKLGLPFILSFFKRINVDKILQRFRALIRQSLEELANDGAAGHFKGFAISCNENRGQFLRTLYNLLDSCDRVVHFFHRGKTICHVLPFSLTERAYSNTMQTSKGDRISLVFIENYVQS